MEVKDANIEIAGMRLRQQQFGPDYAQDSPPLFNGTSIVTVHSDPLST